MSSNKEQSRAYMKRRYHERRKEALELLGGKCRCGSTDDLQVDHVDRTKKTMSFDRMAGVGRVRFLEELRSCQLLCGKCHTKKTVENDLGRRLREHGTPAMYRHGKCRCDACVMAWRSYYAERRKIRAASFGVKDLVLTQA